MNIFILDPSPIISASYHCDLHIHKMVLESAQMASTAARVLELPSALYPSIYKPAYINHPCTVWASESPGNLAWLIKLAKSLESIRKSLGCPEHSSHKVLKHIDYYAMYTLGTGYSYLHHTPFALAMYPRIKIRNDLTTVQKYQLYYRIKIKEWGLTGNEHLMYKGRTVPAFLLSSTKSETNIP